MNHLNHVNHVNCPPTNHKGSNEVILWMEKCDPLRITPNKVMLCTRNIFLLENMRDIFPDEYAAIIRLSGNAGIVKM